MTGSRLYDVVRVGTAAQKVLTRSLELYKKDCKSVIESSSVLRSVYENSTLLQIGVRASGSDLFKKTAVPKQQRYAARKETEVAKAPGAGSGVKQGVSTTFETAKRPTVAPQQHTSPGTANVNQVREYSTSKKDERKYEMESSAVPASRIERLFHYGSLATGLGMGALSEGIRRLGSSDSGSAQGSVMLSPANLERMVRKFSQMRGAVLKVGQLLSFQGMCFFYNPGIWTND